MPIPFDKYDYLTIGDLERNPYSIWTHESHVWSYKDGMRMLWIALDRYAHRLKTPFKVGDRVTYKYGEFPYVIVAHGEITIISSQGCKVLFDGKYDLDYWYYKPEELRFEVNHDTTIQP